MRRARAALPPGLGSPAWAASPLPWLGALLALYLLAPLIAFVVRLRNGIPGAPGIGGALATSLVTATVSAAVIALLGVPLAYLLARARGHGGRLLGAAVALPLALPPLMSGLLLLYVVGPRTALGELFGGGLTETRTGIVLAQTFVAAPFLVIAARAAFAAVDPELEEMAAALGHGRVARFVRVALPCALPGIAAGLVLAWLRAFGEFGATVILAYHPYSLPVFTFVQFDSGGVPATVLPVAVALAAGLAVLAAVALPLPLPRHRRRARVPAPRPPRLAGEPAALQFSLRRKLAGFSLELEHRGRSGRLALLGPSGAGKTLTLRLIAAITDREPDADVRLGGVALGGDGALGYVPQGSALLPGRTVWQQVNFGVGSDPALAAWWIERLGLAGLERRLPRELSGGQRRRVALARALAVEPRVLLLDEPFSGLDAPVRDSLRRELRRLQREHPLASVIVTHDPEEAALLSEEVIVLEDGRVLQAGTRAQVFSAPRSPRVAELLGIPNAHRGRVAGAGRIDAGGLELRADTGALAAGSEVVWCVRPERIALAQEGGYEAVVLDDADLGAARELTVELGAGVELAVRTERAPQLAAGERLRVAIDPASVTVWPAQPAAAQLSTDVGHLDARARLAPRAEGGGGIAGSASGALEGAASGAQL